ncbi:hydrogenase maturation protease [bacterium]|nr:hydrogenase maturation protease [bacterium]
MGLGNTILTDDGVGIYVAREIRNRLKNRTVQIQEAAVGGLELLNCIAGFSKVILIDAVMTGQHRIGTLLKLKPEDFEGGSATARHQIGLHEALLLGRKLGMDLPETLIIYGIEVKDILTFGETCTPEVNASIPEVAEKIIQNEF